MGCTFASRRAASEDDLTVLADPKSPWSTPHPLLPDISLEKHVFSETPLRDSFYAFAAERSAEQYVTFLKAWDNLVSKERVRNQERGGRSEQETVAAEDGLKISTQRLFREYMSAAAPFDLKLPEVVRLQVAARFSDWSQESRRSAREWRLRREAASNSSLLFPSPMSIPETPASNLGTLHEKPSLVFGPAVDHVKDFLDRTFREQFFAYLADARERRKTRHALLAGERLGLRAKPTVVVVGGGICGLYCARSLHELGATSLVDVKVIEPKDYLEFGPALVPALCEGSRAGGWLELGDVVAGTAIQPVRGRVSAVTERHVVLEDTRILAYDALVVATGSKHPLAAAVGSAVSLEHRTREVRAFRARLAAAHGLTCVGRGALAIELAAGAREQWPRLDVALEHAHEGGLCGLVDGAPSVHPVLDPILVRRKIRTSSREPSLSSTASLSPVSPRRRGDVGEHLRVACSEEALSATRFLDSAPWPPSCREGGRQQRLRVNCSTCRVPAAPGLVFAGGAVAVVGSDRGWRAARRHGVVIARNVAHALFPARYPDQFEYDASAHSDPVELRLGKKVTLRKRPTRWEFLESVSSVGGLRQELTGERWRATGGKAPSVGKE
jgi:hypothetical protein